MNLEQDLCALPFVSLSAADRLPDCAGIYFAIDSNQPVLYIGQAKDIAKRWKSRHHRKSELEKHHQRYPVRLAWMAWNLEDLYSAERYFISHFKPLLNGTPVPEDEVFKSEILLKLLLEEIRGLVVVYGVESGTSTTLPKIYLHYNYENSGKNGFAATIKRFKAIHKEQWRYLKSWKRSDHRYEAVQTMRPGSREHKMMSRIQTSFNNHWEIACNGVILDILPTDAEDYKNYRRPENSALRKLAGVKVRAFQSPNREGCNLQAMIDDPIRLFWS
jgi:GIY-YIG catalytic domain